jgi:glycerol-3-phosphate acyltransferase PlsY
LERVILSAVVGFFLGAIPFSLLAGRLLKGIDLREFGSGNLGAANTFRTLGAAPGVTVLLLDVAKGALSVLIASWLWKAGLGLGRTDLMLLAGLCAIAGHVWTPFAAFSGGKGVATAGGVFAVVAPLALLICLVVWVVAVAVTRYISAGSILAAISLPVGVYLTTTAESGRWHSALWISAAVAIIVVARHRGNIARILDGSERRFSLRGGQSGHES